MRQRRTKRNHPGFTLIEMVVSLTAASVLILATAMFLADNQRAFNDTYSHAYSRATEDDISARIVFQKTVRKACCASGMASVASDGSWLEVQYYSRPDSASPDRAARFHVTGRDLRLDTSDLETGRAVAVETLCRTVDSVAFALTGTSAQMFLELNDGSSTRVVNASAVMRSP